MVFMVSSTSYQSMMNTDLLIRCWDPTIKGRIGCIGEAKQNLAFYEQFNKEETYCELDLGYSDTIIVSFKVYFFSNVRKKNIILYYFSLHILLFSRSLTTLLLTL